MLNKPLFTVFTPTFNRAYTLPRLYESLKIQTYTNFEWLIIDDGSTDETYELIKKWQENTTDFLIRYYWQQNRGKHVAFNRGVCEAQGILFLPLDSDDTCTSNALERFAFHWDSIPFEEKSGFAGVCAHCMDRNGKLVGTLFPFNPTDSNSIEIRYRYKVKGEKWGFNRTDILIRFKFPEDENMRFIPEGIVWNGIARIYRTRFVNEILRTYYVEDFKGSDQLSKSLNDIKEIISKKYAMGCAFYYKSLFNDDIKWFRYEPMKYFVSAISYIRFSLHCGKLLNNIYKEIHTLEGKILILFASPIAIILYFLDSKNILLISQIRNKIKNIFCLL